jgi:hypothetical protein
VSWWTGRVGWGELMGGCKIHIRLDRSTSASCIAAIGPSASLSFSTASLQYNYSRSAPLHSVDSVQHSRSAPCILLTAYSTVALPTAFCRQSLCPLHSVESVQRTTTSATVITTLRMFIIPKRLQGSTITVTYRLGHLPVDFDFHAYLHEAMTLCLIHCLEVRVVSLFVFD